MVGDSVHDVLALVRHLFLRRRRSICQVACDINGDGRLRISDIVGLLRLAFRGDEPVSPFPNCGPGLLETDRRLGCDSSPSCR